MSQDSNDRAAMSSDSVASLPDRVTRRLVPQIAAVRLAWRIRIVPSTTAVTLAEEAITRRQLRPLVVSSAIAIILQTVFQFLAVA